MKRQWQETHHDAYRKFLSNVAQKVLTRLQSADMVFRNKGRGLVWLLKLAVVPVSVRTRASDVRVIVAFTRFCYKMAKKSGVKYLVLYLKASQVLLQQSVGGYVLPSTRPLGGAISRSRGGLPRLIPAHHRLAIKAMHGREIRLWMTLLGLYRVLGFVGKVKTSTITDPGKVVPGESIVGFQRFIHNVFFAEALRKFGSDSILAQAKARNAKGKIPLWTDLVGTLQPVLFPISKSGASAVGVETSSSLASLVGAAKAWHLPQHSKLFSDFKEWIRHTGKPVGVQTGATASWGSKLVYKYPLLDLMDKFTNVVGMGPGRLGKLALKEEAAGKIRVFAMADAFTQWALYPLHARIMSTLRRWPQDGTFDQMAPVRRLLQRKEVSGLWSYDLSAATDRLPLQFQKIVLQPILGIHGAEVWGRILTDRDYYLKHQPYRYAVGQPMGAYSSWAMLALTHHALVQWSYYRVCTRIGMPYRWFELYAVLGDDVIIGHSGVAAEYLAVMDTLGVGIGLAKSLVSPTKLVGEFAKRFFIPRDVSMVPLKEVIAARFNGQERIEFVRKYRLDPIQALTFSGVGYKVKGSLNKEFSKLGNHTSNLLLALSHPSGPLALGLSNWLQQIGYNRLGPKITSTQLVAFLDLELSKLTERLSARLEERRQVFQMMMVKRDHGNRFNPFDHLYEVYDLILAKLDGYTYEISEIEKEAKALKLAISADLAILHKIEDLQRRLDALPKPDDFTSRSSAVKSVRPISKVTQIWRDAFKCRTNQLNRWNPKGK